MRDLGSEIRDYIDAAAPPIAIDDVRSPPEEKAMPTKRPSRSRRTRWSLVATAAVFIIAVVALTSHVHPDRSKEHLAAGPVTTAAGPAATATAGPMTTAAQGSRRWLTSFGTEAPIPVVPAGWKVLDFGEFRFAVPAQWTVPVSAGCARSSSADSGVVLVPHGGSGGGICIPADPLPASVLTFRTVTTPAGSGSPADVGTLHATRVVNPACRSCGPIYRFADGYQLTVTGPQAKRVLATFTDSGARRVLQQGPVTDTSTWRSVEFGGISLRVPPSWHVNDLRSSGRTTTRNGITEFSGGGNPGECGGPLFTNYQPPQVSIGQSKDYPACPMSITLDIRPADGVWIRSPDPAGSPSGTPIAHGDLGGADVTVIRVATSARQTPSAVLDLIVRSHSNTTWISIGAGSNPSIARTILWSLRAG